MRLEREVCGMTSSVSQEAVTLHLFNITATIGSVTDVAIRTNCDRLPLEQNINDKKESSTLEPVPKRMRLNNNVDLSNTAIRPIIQEVEYLTDRLNATWDLTH